MIYNKKLEPNGSPSGKKLNAKRSAIESEGLEGGLLKMKLIIDHPFNELCLKFY